MLELNALRDFVAVMRDGGFGAAAKRLNVPKSTVSKRVQSLEEALGVRLIERTTRALRLTPEGTVLHARAVRLLADAEEAERILSEHSSIPEGRLKLSVPQLFGQTKMAAIIARCRALYPDLTLDVVLGDGRIDLIEDGFDAAIRVGHLPDSSLIARTFAIARNVIVSAPALLAQRNPSDIESPDRLDRLPALAFSSQQNGRAHWSLHQTNNPAIDIPIEPVVCINSLMVLRELCLAGTGVAVLPHFVIASDLEAGRLVQLLPDWSGPEVPLSIVYPSGRFMSARLRALIDVLIEAFPSRSL